MLYSLTDRIHFFIVSICSNIRDIADDVHQWHQKLMGMVEFIWHGVSIVYYTNYRTFYGRYQNYNISLCLCLFLSQNKAFAWPVSTMHVVWQPNIRERNGRAWDVRGVWGEDELCQDSSERGLLVRNRQTGRIKEEKYKSYVMQFPFVQGISLDGCILLIL